jgi:Flp pilus assembly protein TadD
VKKFSPSGPAAVCLAALLLLPGCAARKRPDPTLALDNNWETGLKIIRAAEAGGSLSVALSAAARELELRPENLEARLILARLQTRDGTPDKALATLAALPEKTAPNAEQDASLALEKGRALLALGKIPEAKEAFGRLPRDLSPASLRREAEKLRAVAFDLEGRHEDAQSLYRSVLAEREDAAVRYNLGRSLLAGGQYLQAAETLLPLADMQDMPRARLAAAAALAKSGRKEMARNMLSGQLAPGTLDSLLEGF